MTPKSSIAILSPWEAYNALPTFEEAKHVFAKTSEDSLKDLISLFANYPDFGFCLVHRHCELYAEERMVEHKLKPSDHPPYISVTSPIKFSELPTAYPSAWLNNGTPFEYSRASVPSIPYELLEEFKRSEVTKQYIWKDGVSFLGVCFVGSEVQLRIQNDPDCQIPKYLEETIERENFLRETTKEDWDVISQGRGVKTCWVVCPKDGDKKDPCCICICDQNSGGHPQVCVRIASMNLQENSILSQ